MSANKKIAIVSPVFPPYRGGIGTVAYHQARVLRERGLDVAVLTPETLKPIIKYGNAAWMPSLKKRLKDFDVVVLQYPFFGGMKAVYSAKKKYNFKLITNYNMDVVGSGIKGLIFNYATKYFLPRIVKISDFVLASSEDYAVHSNLGKYWESNNPKFKIVPNGVDINRFAFSDAQREPIVLFVGGLDVAHYFKGVEYLIRAVPLVPGDCKVIIAGKGELMDKYKKLAQDLGVADKVEFVGGVSDEELVKLYQRASVTVLPSIDQSEAFGIVLVESMACGTPVISSDLPGVHSVYENNISGFSVPVKDVKALAEKISYILNNPEKARAMGQAGRKLTEERYNWNVIAEKLNSLL